MGHKFAELAFTPKVKAAQEQNGSRRAYSRMEAGEDHHDVLGPNEAGFIVARDSFYMATVSETGWPYIQHRGGPAGFVRVLDDGEQALLQRQKCQWMARNGVAGDGSVKRPKGQF